MKAEKWSALSRTHKATYVLGAALIAVLLVSKLFSGGSSTADDQPRQPVIGLGVHVSTNRGYAGCRREEDAARFTSLMAANDTTAAMAFLDQADCQLMPEGTTGTVEDQNGWHHSICIRQNGRPFCSWIPKAIADQVE